MKPKSKKRKLLVHKPDHTDADERANEWMNGQHTIGKPNNPTHGCPVPEVSEYPEATLGWLKANCRFATSN